MSRKLGYSGDPLSGTKIDHILALSLGGLIVLVILLAIGAPAKALTGDDVSPGTACANEDAVMMTANPAGSGGYILTCDGGTWKAIINAADPTEDAHVATKKYVDDQAGGVPPGAVMAFAMTTAPTGWLEANGAAVSRTDYAALFAIIGTTYGAGDGTTTFNLPDLRGEFLRGWDNGRGADPGRVLGTAQADSLGSHDHTGSTSSSGAHSHTIPIAGSGGSAIYPSVTGAVSDTPKVTSTAGAHNHVFTTDSTGGTETRPRNVAILFAIKY